MQNLRNVDYRILKAANDLVLTATAFDLTDDSLICAFGPSPDNSLLSLKRFRPTTSNDELERIAAWDAVCPRPELSHDRIVDLHHFSDNSTIVLVLAGGDIVVVREDPGADEDAVEIVGSVDDGISAASWSPDEELLLLATCSNTLLWMTRQLDSTTTNTLSVDDLSVSNHVSVGWGKVETQFKGRGARALRDPTIPEHVDAGVLSPRDSGQVNISWRGYGQFVAVNSVLLSEPQRRVIRVFSRGGVLENVSEAVDNMEDAVAWKPSGQTIASVQRLKDRAQVIFFERNGLRHGAFDLRLDSSDLQAGRIVLNWNVDSSVLAVSFGKKVQLWTTSNYHWYLKQVIQHTSGVTCTHWHPEKRLSLACFTAYHLHAVQYLDHYTRGPINVPHDDGLVVVIDGTQLSLTPLMLANIPPPMAYDSLQLTSTAIDVAVHPAGKTIAVLHHDSVSLYECDYSVRPAKKAELIARRELPNKKAESVTPRQIAIDAASMVVVLLATTQSSQSSLIQYLDGQDGIHSSLGSSATSCFTDVGPGRVILHNIDGQLSQVTAHDKQAAKINGLQHSIPSIPASCLETQLWCYDGNNISFGRTTSGQLHIHSDVQRLKVAGCTSFAVTSSYLIFTTAQHFLKFVHLHAGVLEVPPDEPEKDERCRNIERGAKIVTVMPSAFALVLQMPRGNLETIYPRALVLAEVRRNLLRRDYKKAFLTCRSQRVDLNILYDYIPEQLLADVELFIKQVRKIEHIDLFLSSLIDEDVTKTLYRETAVKISHNTHALYEKHESSAPVSEVRGVSKVNLICDTFLKALDGLGPAYLQSVVTAHVSKVPPDLEAGLRLVSLLRSQPDEAKVEQAVEHICFLTDVNKLYDTALSMYDLDVTLLVAQQSQKDPREYLPYIQSLRDMSTNRMRYTIDNDLKKYNKALVSLHALDAFEELTRYVDRYELHADAIGLYRHDGPRLHELVRRHATFLSSRSRYHDAGIAFEFVGDYRAAYEAYRAANLWRETLTVAALIPVDAQELHDQAQALSDSLCESKDYTAAALIHLEYLDDLAGGIKLQCKAYNFAEAMRLAVSRASPALLNQVVDPGLIECSGAMTELLAEMKTQLNAQVPRLRDLRKRKIEEPMAFLDAGENENGDFPDNLSIAPTDASTSGGTFMTRYTNRSTGTLASNASRKTSKGRRREERKRARGKKGTVYEEEYLVNSVTRLIERLNETTPDVGRLVEGLMRRSMRERAVAVENAMLEVQQICRENMTEVYQTALVPADDSAEPSTDHVRPPRGQGVLWESLAASQKTVEAPILKAYERLSLLSS